MYQVAILISGKGTNLQSLHRYTVAPKAAACIAVVISNRQDAKGLQYAKQHNIPNITIPDDTEEKREDALLKALSQYNVACLCLAGFMRILSPHFLRTCPIPILNIHPSLLPSFKGLNPHSQALNTGVSIAGCTIHLVSEEVDGGPIIAQAATLVKPCDTALCLQKRILSLEHVLYPKLLHALATGACLLSKHKHSWRQGECCSFLKET